MAKKGAPTPQNPQDEALLNDIGTIEKHLQEQEMTVRSVRRLVAQLLTHSDAISGGEITKKVAKHAKKRIGAVAQHPKLKSELKDAVSLGLLGEVREIITEQLQPKTEEKSKDTPLTKQEFKDAIYEDEKWKLIRGALFSIREGETLTMNGSRMFRAEEVKIAFLRAMQIDEEMEAPTNAAKLFETLKDIEPTIETLELLKESLTRELKALPKKSAPKKPTAETPEITAFADEVINSKAYADLRKQVNRLIEIAQDEGAIDKWSQKNKLLKALLAMPKTQKTVARVLRETNPNMLTIAPEQAIAKIKKLSEAIERWTGVLAKVEPAKKAKSEPKEEPKPTAKPKTNTKKPKAPEASKIPKEKLEELSGVIPYKELNEAIAAASEHPNDIDRFILAWKITHEEPRDGMPEWDRVNEKLGDEVKHWARFMNLPDFREEALPVATRNLLKKLRITLKPADIEDLKNEEDEAELMEDIIGIYYGTEDLEPAIDKLLAILEIEPSKAKSRREQRYLIDVQTEIKEVLHKEIPEIINPSTEGKSTKEKIEIIKATSIRESVKKLEEVKEAIDTLEALVKKLPEDLFEDDEPEEDEDEDESNPETRILGKVLTEKERSIERALVDMPSEDSKLKESWNYLMNNIIEKIRNAEVEMQSEIKKLNTLHPKLGNTFKAIAASDEGLWYISIPIAIARIFDLNSAEECTAKIKEIAAMLQNKEEPASLTVRGERKKGELKLATNLLPKEKQGWGGKLKEKWENAKYYGKGTLRDWKEDIKSLQEKRWGNKNAETKKGQTIRELIEGALEEADMFDRESPVCNAIYSLTNEMKSFELKQLTAFLRNPNLEVNELVTEWMKVNRVGLEQNLKSHEKQLEQKKTEIAQKYKEKLKETVTADQAKEIGKEIAQLCKTRDKLDENIEAIKVTLQLKRGRRRYSSPRHVLYMINIFLHRNNEDMNYTTLKDTIEEQINNERYPNNKKETGAWWLKKGMGLLKPALKSTLRNLKETDSTLAQLEDADLKILLKGSSEERREWAKKTYKKDKEIMARLIAYLELGLQDGKGLHLNSASRRKTEKLLEVLKGARHEFVKAQVKEKASADMSDADKMQLYFDLVEKNTLHHTEIRTDLMRKHAKWGPIKNMAKIAGLAGVGAAGWAAWPATFAFLGASAPWVFGSSGAFAGIAGASKWAQKEGLIDEKHLKSIYKGAGRGAAAIAATGAGVALAPAVAAWPAIVAAGGASILPLLAPVLAAGLGAASPEIIKKAIKERKKIAKTLKLSGKIAAGTVGKTAALTAGVAGTAWGVGSSLFRPGLAIGTLGLSEVGLFAYNKMFKK